jgi:hypothetical protein
MPLRASFCLDAACRVYFAFRVFAPADADRRDVAHRRHLRRAAMMPAFAHDATFRLLISRQPQAGAARA